MVKAIKAAQLADQIRDYLSLWTTTDLRGYFFSITQVTLSNDLQFATVWVDVLSKEQEKMIMANLDRRLKIYQSKLVHEMQKRVIPYLKFRIDDSQERSERFDQLLKQ